MSKARSGGGITSNKLVQSKALKAEPKATAISPGAVSRIGSHPSPLTKPKALDAGRVAGPVGPTQQRCRCWGWRRALGASQRIAVFDPGCASDAEREGHACRVRTRDRAAWPALERNHAMIEEQLLEIEAKRRGLSVTQLRMQMAVGPDLMADLRADARRSSPAQPTSALEGTAKAKRSGPGSNGWVASRPLQSPTGVGNRGSWSHQVAEPQGAAQPPSPAKG
jgi:hypothetical protein